MNELTASEAADYLENAINAWGPDEGLELTQTGWKMMRLCIIALLRERERAK